MRNFLVRTIAGAVFVAVVIVPLLYFKPAVPFIAGLSLVVMLREFYAMNLGKGVFHIQRFLAVLSAVLVFAAFWCVRDFGMDVRFIAAAFLPLILIPLVQVTGSEKFQLDYLADLFAGLIYIALPVCLLPLLLFHAGEFDGVLLLSFFILVWSSDVGAYCLGTLLGQKPDSRKLAPEISPKKSWWGVMGGVFLCIIASIVLYYVGFLKFAPAHCVAVGLLISIGSIVGDLFESLWKRHCGVKDSGNFIPGHGGLLDRFDSSLVAMPLAAIYLYLFDLL